MYIGIIKGLTDGETHLSNDGVKTLCGKRLNASREKTDDSKWSCKLCNVVFRKEHPEHIVRVRKIYSNSQLTRTEILRIHNADSV